MSKVSRDTHRDKIVTLLSYEKGIEQKMEYSYNLQKIERVSEKNMNNSFWWASTISIILCLYMAVFYDIIIEYGQAEYTANLPIGLVRFVLSCVQMIFSLLYFYYWHKLNIWFEPEPESRQNPNAREEE
jgi:hypothetical protein